MLFVWLKFYEMQLDEMTLRLIINTPVNSLALLSLLSKRYLKMFIM